MRFKFAVPPDRLEGDHHGKPDPKLLTVREYHADANLNISQFGDHDRVQS